MPSSSSIVVKLARIVTAACGLAALVALLRSMRARRLIGWDNPNANDGIEYPEIRAHVYFASPEQSFKAALDAISSLPDFLTVSADESSLRLMAEVRASASGQSHKIVIEALPLGPRHTRVVVRGNTASIHAIQAAMDQKLTGG